MFYFSKSLNIVALGVSSWSFIIAARGWINRKIWGGLIETDETVDSNSVTCGWEMLRTLVKCLSIKISFQFQFHSLDIGSFGWSLSTHSLDVMYTWYCSFHRLFVFWKQNEKFYLTLEQEQERVSCTATSVRVRGRTRYEISLRFRNLYTARMILGVQMSGYRESDPSVPA